MFFLTIYKNRMNKIKQVKLDRRATCLTYAIQRVGLEFLFGLGLKTVSELEHFFDFEIYDASKIERGTLVCWNLLQENINVPNQISEDGVITENPLLINFHLGVIEDPIQKTVSDSTRKIIVGIPIIRIRNIEDIRQPDLILNLKKQFLKSQPNIQAKL